MMHIIGNKIFFFGAAGVTQELEYLPSKHKDLNSNSRTAKKDIL
jgi:hypothetical protein